MYGRGSAELVIRIFANMWVCDAMRKWRSVGKSGDGRRYVDGRERGKKGDRPGTRRDAQMSQVFPD